MKSTRRAVETAPFAEPACSPFALVSLVAPFAIARGAARAPAGRPALQGSVGSAGVAGDVFAGLAPQGSITPASGTDS